MHTVRQKILSFIIDQPSTTVDELSKVFRVTPANIRHHLSILTNQGVVKVIGQKQVHPNGRPAHIYRASKQVDVNNFDRLSDALLITLMKSSRHVQDQNWVKGIADQISEKIIIDPGNPTKRLYNAIRALNRMNYHAKWEAHIEQPRIMFEHCPYINILGDHPELCKMDSFLLENLLNSPVRQIEKQSINSHGLPQCVFLKLNAPKIFT